MDIKMTTSAHPEGVDIASLPIPELKRVVTQMSQEVEVLAGSLQSLKSAQSQFADSRECLDIVKAAEEGKEMLVPLSSSLYVPGKLIDTKHVLVDIGTGYHAEKTIQDAEEYFNRKVDYLKEQMEKIQVVLQQKFSAKQLVAEVLQAKIMQQAKPSQS